MLTDGTLAEFAARLGIPGFVDIHTHFMPANVPAHQIQVLEALGFGDDWMRVMCFENGARLYPSPGD
jgi:cytosine/adenosine deaminase-related metal-dependent hydrolase